MSEAHWSGTESDCSGDKKVMEKVEEILRISKNGGRNDLSKLTSDEKKVLQRTRNRISAQNHRQKQKRLLENLRASLTRSQRDAEELKARNANLHEVLRLLKIESDTHKLRKQQLEQQLRSVIQLVSNSVLAAKSQQPPDPAVLVNALTLALNVTEPPAETAPRLDSSLAEQIASLLSRHEVKGT